MEIICSQTLNVHPFCIKCKMLSHKICIKIKNTVTKSNKLVVSPSFITSSHIKPLSLWDKGQIPPRLFCSPLSYDFFFCCYRQLVKRHPCPRSLVSTKCFHFGRILHDVLKHVCLTARGEKMEADLHELRDPLIDHTEGQLFLSEAFKVIVEEVLRKGTSVEQKVSDATKTS